MRPQNDSSERGYGLGFEIRILFARLYLMLESIWRHGRIFLCLSGLFIALSLLDVWSFTGGILHMVFLALFGIGILLSLYAAIGSIPAPTRKRALRYMEARNHLHHRPLQSLGESSNAEQKNNTPASLMWGVYQKSLRRNLKGLRIGSPNLDMGAGDSYAFRALVILLLTMAFIVAGPKSGERIAAAFTPNIGAAAEQLEVTAWITPPAYTAQAPILLTNKQDATDTAEATIRKNYVIPAQSSFIAHVFGDEDGVPILWDGDKSTEFERLDRQNFQIETTFDTSAIVQIEKDGDIISSWQVTVIADEAPKIELLMAPEVTERKAFKLQYQAQDDYGVAQIGGEITRENSDGKIELALPAPGRGSKQIVGKSYHDLTAHPWAGLPVKLSLFVEDQIGQKGTSKKIDFTLPERIFTHPVAKALIEQRKKLVADPEENREMAAIALGALSELPQSLNDDYTVMLALSTASAQLANGRDQKSVDDVVDLLWDTALRLENGNLSQAAAALRAAQQALMEALNNNASDSEIKQKVEELRAAMDKFLQAMAEQAPDNAQQQGNVNPDDQMISQQDLQSLLDRVDQLARNGARDAARQLLSELQDIMENLKNAQGGQPTANQQAAQKMLNDLGKLMQQQQQLMDETLRKSQSSPGQQPQDNGSPSDQSGRQPGQSGQGGSLQGLAPNQEALRQMLGEMMRKLGERGDIPQELGQAERSMNGARQSLEQGQGKPALQGQGDALEALRQGAESLAQQMMSNGPGQGGKSKGMGQMGQGRDPLGRPLPEDNQGSTSTIGEMRGEAEGFNRSRNIRDEVQRRLSDPSRSSLERSYLNRLIDIF
ncbi:TIGR02302 family protein [Sneathiella sp.]|uniref:TIGR02302 family protein n=1 Tax=Sneathiella sp. TaxID=1964365 RepID=UPI00356844F5